jgi:hypothetical protein
MHERTCYTNTEGKLMLGWQNFTVNTGLAQSGGGGRRV